MQIFSTPLSKAPSSPNLSNTYELLYSVAKPPKWSFSPSILDPSVPTCLLFLFKFNSVALKVDITEFAKPAQRKIYNTDGEKFIKA